MFHIQRAHVLYRSGYDLERWQTGPKRSDIRKAQVHRRAIRIANVRAQLSDFRTKRRRLFEQYAASQEVWGSCEDNPPAASKAVYDCIHGAAIEHGTPEDWLLRIASCESHYDPRAYNPSGASGLFQFMPSTFASTPYGGESIWSARASSLAAAWMFRQGRAGEWSCN